MTKTLILCYHGFSSDNSYAVSPERFEEHMASLASYATFIPLSDVTKPPKDTDSPYRVCITIDDGYQDVLSIIPTIQKYQIPVTLFVLSDPKKAQTSELGSHTPLLTKKHIHALQKKGWCIGCHSATHPDFSSAETPLDQEITHAHQTLENELKTSILAFSYPKGKYSSRADQIIRSSGYQQACTTLPGFCTPQSDPYILPRTVVRSYHTPSHIKHMFSSFWHIRETLRNAYQYHMAPVIGSFISIGQDIHQTIQSMMRSDETAAPPPIPHLPKTLDGYTLVRHLNDDMTASKFRISIYKKQKKLYIVKAWAGTKKDLYYYELFHEYRNTKAFWHLTQSQNQTPLRVPKPILYEDRGQYAYMITEYIPGQALSKKGEKKRIQVVQEVLSYLRILSQHPDIWTSGLSIRSIAYYIISLPVIAAIALFHQEIPSPLVFSSFCKACMHIPHIARQPLVITHRDLIDDNIIVHGPHIYLLDCAYMNLSPDGYDRSYYAIHTHEKEFADPFFTRYISLLNGNYHDPITKENIYKTALKMYTLL